MVPQSGMGMRTLSLPHPLSRPRGRGVSAAADGVRAVQPRARALGYYLPPLTGLPKDSPRQEDLC